MCDKSNLKVESSNLPNNVAYCNACLSTERRLQPMGDLYLLFQEICGDIITYKSNVSLVNFRQVVCWECATFLKKVRGFKRKVDIAQEILQKCCGNNKPFPVVNLSNLGTAKFVVDLQQREAEKSTEEQNNDFIASSIKQEDDLDEMFDYDNGIDYKNEIKVELILEDSSIISKQLSDHESEVNEMTSSEQKEDKLNVKVDRKHKKFKSKESKGQNHKFRIISNINCKSLRKKIKINANEVIDWMMRERNNVMYKSFPFRCDKCVLIFKDQEELVNHYKKRHYETLGDYSCDICISRFATKPQLETHIMKHCRIQLCTVCGYECYSDGVMKTHIADHKDKLQCLECRACFKEMRWLRRHRREMHTACVCDYCGRRCVLKQTLVKHIRRNHLDSYSCDACNKTFKNYKTLCAHNKMRHTVVHTESAYCVQCDRQFDNMALYRRHVAVSVAHAKERKAKPKKKISCPVCGKIYARNTYMMNHYNYVHAKQSKYYCVDCDRYFLSSTRYTDHRRYHHEGVKKEKNKLCNICGRGFATNKTLTHHIRTHTGERPHECTFCTAKFAQRTALQTHIKHIHMKLKRTGVETII